MAMIAAPPERPRDARAPHVATAAKTGKPRGRPALISREEVLEHIARLAREGAGLFRVHHRHPGPYARARRFYGSWAEAVRRAGLDYDAAIHAARVMSRDSLRKPPRPSGNPSFKRGT